MLKPKLKLLAFTLLLIMLVVSCKTEISLKSLKEGTTSKYVISTNTTDTSGKTDTFEMDLEYVTLPWRQIGEQKVLPTKVTTQEETKFVFLAEDEYGIYTYAEQGTNDEEPILREGKRYNIKHPYEAGNSWDYSNSKGENFTSTIIKEEKVTVPAGNFKCLKIETTGKQPTDGGYEMNYSSSEWIDSYGYMIKYHLKGKVPVGYPEGILYVSFETLIQLSSRSKK